MNGNISYLLNTTKKLLAGKLGTITADLEGAGVFFFIVINQMLYSDHKHDVARAEDALTLSYGSELIGMQRDWNEELQSCWEFLIRLLRKGVVLTFFCYASISCLPDVLIIHGFLVLTIY
uniref:Uncharacterized protein n=1 Tax=Nelumbo nucifera TaxID=4432 RepID=A0A822XCR8_NELNU|nr:TPA_asm: hypothetical protein HUJ06_020687 [Nelumbo nucifera]